MGSALDHRITGNRGTHTLSPMPFAQRARGARKPREARLSSSQSCPPAARRAGFGIPHGPTIESFPSHRMEGALHDVRATARADSRPLRSIQDQTSRPARRQALRPLPPRGLGLPGVRGTHTLTLVSGRGQSSIPESSSAQPISPQHPSPHRDCKRGILRARFHKGLMVARPAGTEA
jgi:hypothetical protein